MRKKNKTLPKAVLNTTPVENGAADADPLNRRNFLMQALVQTGKISLATGVIYGVSYLTSKNGNTAGAK